MENITNKKWWRALGIRLIKSAAETLLAIIGTQTMLNSINWLEAISATILSCIIAFLTALKGLPEATIWNGEERRSK